MENIEFIAAKDLPTTEAEEVDVLCVEGGELKRKPGASLGGGAGGYIMKPTLEECTFNADVDVVLISKNYDEMARVVEAGGHVTIVIPAGLLGGNPAFAIIPTMWMYDDGEGLLASCWLGPDKLEVGFTNGTYVPSLE